jgi:hypothetical protein
LRESGDVLQSRPLLRGLSIMFGSDSAVSGMTIVFRMQKPTSLSCRFLFFHASRKRPGGSVLTNAGYLPGDLHVGLVSLDSKAVVFNPAGYDRLRELADHRQLVTKITIQGLEIVRQRDGCIALAIGDGLATIDVHQVRRLH